MTYEYTNKNGKRYYLHKMNGRELYYFKNKQDSNAVELPENYKIVVSPSGLPMAKKR